MGESKTKSPGKRRGRRTETHGKREVNGGINAKSKSWRQDQRWPNASVDDDDDAH